MTASAGRTGAATGRPLWEWWAIGALGGALTLAPSDLSRAAAEALPAWYTQGVDANAALCGHTPPPSWCGDWIAALEAARPPAGPEGAPEWRHRPVAEAVRLCTTLWSPVWCGAWRAAMAETATTEAYRAEAARRRAAADAARARAAAAGAAWQGVVERVAAGAAGPDEVAAVRRRADTGDLDALELLAWMYVEGRGVMVDYPRAYELYARAVLAGRADLRPNLEALWRRLTDQARQRLERLFTRVAPPPAVVPP